MANKGCSFDFVLDRLPCAQYDIFVDAADSWGIGGCCGKYYFRIPLRELPYIRGEIITRKELRACLIGIFCFGDLIRDKLVRVYTDNECAYH